jgi:hypothetical protein
MPEFPADARRDKVLRAFALPGFQVAIKEHIHLERKKPAGTTPATLPNRNNVQGPTLIPACLQAGISKKLFYSSL